MFTWFDRQHDLIITKHSAYGQHPATNAFPNNKISGRTFFMITGQHFAGSAKAGLYLIGNK